jgi:inosine-uridine nucleoside N-ribohydrolase
MTNPSICLLSMGFLTVVAARPLQADQESLPGDPGIEPVNVIFDTDLHTDCDDAGALAVLHALADAGEAEVVGTIHSAPAQWGPACLDAVNTYYGRGGVHVGATVWPDYETSPTYAQYRSSQRAMEKQGSDYLEIVASSFPRTHSPGEFMNGPLLYRKLLAASSDDSVVICATGQLTALAQLLDTPPDTYSPLDGQALVAQKVRLFVTMAKGGFPKGRDPFNWSCDIPSAARVLNSWPGPMAVVPLGDQVMTGGRLVSTENEGNPIKRIYDIYVKRDDKNRPSWDQCAMLYAVRGTGNLFHERTGHRIRFEADTGEHEWAADPSSKQVVVEQAADEGTLAAVIEELMCRPPRHAAAQRVR